MLEFVGAIDPTKSEARVLDKLKVEKERGITVKAQTASVIYSEWDWSYETYPRANSAAIYY